MARGKAGEFRTRAPGRFGGNLDVRELTAGATLYLPVETAGALFSAGDAHAAQGDGEVCINGMEMPADVTLRFKLHKGKHLAGPMVESAECQTPAGAEWIVVESGEDYAIAARNATSRMIDLLVDHWNFSPIHAYLLCSVAMNLRLSQVVNRPMVTISAAIPKSILPVESALLSATPSSGFVELGTMKINNPKVVEELAGLYAVYERALVENDVSVLTALFWDSEHALRFGAGENLYGTEEIQAFRKGSTGGGLGPKHHSAADRKLRGRLMVR